MICSRIVIPLLVAIAVSARCIRAQAPALCTAAQAGAQQQFCKDCKTAVKCISEAAPVTVTTCAAGTACWLFTAGPGNSVAGCKTISTTPCKCSTTKICDAYDPLKSWSCTNDALSPSTTCVAPQACSAGSCATITNTPSPITGVCLDGDESKFIYMNQTCTSAGYCIGPGSPYVIKECDAGQYVDTNSGDCVTAPPQPCEDCVGACPDKTNCLNWNICSSPAPALIAQQQCPEKQFFDATTGTCGTEAKKCLVETACNFGSTVTESTISTKVTESSTISTPVKRSTSSTTVTERTTSTTVKGSIISTTVTGSAISTTVTRSTIMPTNCNAANVGKSYEYPGDCKKYNGCRLATTTTYKYVVGTCAGTLVFNPTTSYCDLPANVPSCTANG